MHKLRLCLELVDECAREEWASEIAPVIAREASVWPGQLGPEVAMGLLDALHDGAADPHLRARVLYEQGAMLQSRKDENSIARAETYFERLCSEHPDNELAQRAAGFLYRIRNLRIGMKVPEFALKDVDGNELRLSDYSGHVVVIDFWGFW